MTDFFAICPGTHSKHVIYKNNEIDSFTTYLTGELFSIISKHSLLGKDLSYSTMQTFHNGPKEPKLESFLKGVNAAQTGAITSMLFTTWSHRLFETIAQDDCLDYLSGLLIGYELRHCNASHCFIVGSGELCARYQIACDELCIINTTIDGDEAFVQGLTNFKKGFKR